jgi:hypothetical protein
MGKAADTSSGPDPQGRPAAGPQTPEGEMTERQRIEFRCVRNAAYHEDFEYHYARAHRVLMFVVVAVGTFAAGMSLATWLSQTHDSIYPVLGTSGAVLAGLIDLVWDVDGRARLHASLRRKCFDLLARLRAGESEDNIDAELIRTYADEPPTKHAVNALAFNAAVDAMGRPGWQKYRVS